MVKKNTVNQILSGIALAVLLALVAYDSFYHFDSEIVQIKRNNDSAQRNWNVTIDQSVVYRDSSFRYEKDFTRIKSLVQPDSTLLSDLTTSYFAASYLPVIVPNVHRHHGRRFHGKLIEFLDKRYICYLEFSENAEKVRKYLATNRFIDYILLNKDMLNINRKRDCLAFKSETLIEKLPNYSTLMYEGEYLNLYRLFDE